MADQFDQRSVNELQTVDHRLNLLLHVARRIFPFQVTEGHRSHERQQDLFEQGRTKARPGESKHNSWPSKAVDLITEPLDWNDRERFTLLAGVLLGVAGVLGVPLRWGGDWDRDTEVKDNRFDDLVHFEIDE